MPANGRRHSPEALGPDGSISRGTRYGLARRRQLALVLPADLVHLQASGSITPALQPFFTAAAIEGTALVLGYEGEAGTSSHRPMSAPKKALLDDYLRAGLIMRGELARYAQTQDADAGSRAITAMGRRATILEKLGLEHVEHTIGLDEYRLARESRAQATIEVKSDTEGRP